MANKLQPIHSSSWFIIRVCNYIGALQQHQLNDVINAAETQIEESNPLRQLMTAAADAGKRAAAPAHPLRANKNVNN